jgi:hypothetical protein
LDSRLHLEHKPKALLILIDGKLVEKSETLFKTILIRDPKIYSENSDAQQFLCNFYALKRVKL